MAKGPSKTTKPKAAAKPKKAVAELTKAPAKPKAQPAISKPKAVAKPKAATKPKAAAKPRPKPAKPEPGVIKQTTDAISQLASDILADRIVPTIEQIKSIAASALGQDQTKGKRPKKKK